MPTRTLTIQLDPDGVAALATAGQQVLLARPVGDSGHLVTWQAVHPVQEIEVSWAGDFRVYQASTAPAIGARIRARSVAEAAPGNRYRFRSGRFVRAGTDQAQPEALARDQFAVVNDDPELQLAGVAMLTGGLLQAAVVNDEPTWHPIAAVSVLYGQEAMFRPDGRVAVLAAGGAAPGTLLDRRCLDLLPAGADQRPVGGLSHSLVYGPALIIDLESEDRTVHYDPRTHQFVAGPAA